MSKRERRPYRPGDTSAKIFYLMVIFSLVLLVAFVIMLMFADAPL